MFTQSCTTRHHTPHDVEVAGHWRGKGEGRHWVSGYTRKTHAHACSRWHYDLVENYRSARDSQHLRMIEWTKGCEHGEEEDRFYGRGEHDGGGIETKIIFKSWLHGSRQPTEEDYEPCETTQTDTATAQPEAPPSPAPRSPATSAASTTSTSASPAPSSRPGPGSVASSATTCARQRRLPVTTSSSGSTRTWTRCWRSTRRRVAGRFRRPAWVGRLHCLVVLTLTPRRATCTVNPVSPSTTTTRRFQWHA